MKERLRSLLKTGLQAKAHQNGIQGSIDRAHNGIVSGWLHCDRCVTSTVPRLDLGSSAAIAGIEQRLTDRADVPGGRGFLFRFLPIQNCKNESHRVDVYCPRHPETRISKMIDASVWAIPALGAIQYHFWPSVTGWVLVLDPNNAATPPRLEIGDREDIPLLSNSVSDQIAEQLGCLGLTSFTIDLSTGTGLAALNGTSLVLSFQNVPLDETVVRGSFLTSTPSTCLLRRTNSVRLPHIGKRDSDWIKALTAQQFDRYVTVDYSVSENRQWHEFLRRLGIPEQPIAAWIVLRHLLQNPIAVTEFLPPCAIEQLKSSPDEKSQSTSSSATYLELINELTNSSLSLRSCGLMAVPQTPTEALQVDEQLKICVVGLVNHKSGLGQNCKNSITALNLAGAHVCDAPVNPFPGGWNPALAVHSGSVCDLSDHTVILHLPIDRVQETFAMQPALATAKRIIGYFMWETEVLPVDLFEGLDLVDEIWTATDFVADALSASSSTPVFVTGHAVNSRSFISGDLNRSKFGLADDAFVVHFSFDANSTVARKNPNASLRAFSTAFGSDPNCVFVLKIRNFQQVEWLAQRGCRHSAELLELIAAMPNLRLITSEMEHAEALAWIAISDCYLSLHRSEGFGYTIAEALSLGVPTIATGYSGCASFRDFEDFHPIEFSMSPILPGEYFYSEKGMAWAEANIEMASSVLQELRLKGQTGSENRNTYKPYPTDPYSLERLSSRYMEILTGTRRVQSETQLEVDDK